MQDQTLHAKLGRLMRWMSPDERRVCANGLAAKPSWNRDLPALAALSGASLVDLERRASSGRSTPALLDYLERLPDLGADESSRRRLQERIDVAVAFFAGTPQVEQLSESATINLRFNNTILEITFPDTVSAPFLMAEVFVVQEYAPPASLPTVDHIFDIGANIGLATLFLAASHPQADIVCVEPEQTNVRYLRRNIEANRVPARVLPVAAGAADGEITLYAFDASFFGNHSTMYSQYPIAHNRVVPEGKATTVPLVAFDKIITGRNYGLKIDCEGGEHDLAYFPELIANAAWVAGEIHYTHDFAHPNGDKFERLVEEYFEIAKLDPVVLADGNILIKQFRTLAKR